MLFIIWSIEFRLILFSEKLQSGQQLLQLLQLIFLPTLKNLNIKSIKIYISITINKIKNLSIIETILLILLPKIINLYDNI